MTSQLQETMNESEMMPTDTPAPNEQTNKNNFKGSFRNTPLINSGPLQANFPAALLARGWGEPQRTGDDRMNVGGRGGGVIDLAVLTLVSCLQTDLVAARTPLQKNKAKNCLGV